MKRLLLLLLTAAGVLGEPPYPARGWRPHGQQFLLPQRPTRLQRIQPRLSFRPSPEFFERLSKPVIFPKLLSHQERPQFRLSPAELEQFGRSPENYRTLPQEVYREPPPKLQQYKYTTIPEDLVSQNARFNNYNNYPRIQQEFRRPQNNFQSGFPQRNQFRPSFAPQSPVIRTQQQFMAPRNPVRFPQGRNPGLRPMGPPRGNVAQTQQQFLPPNRAQALMGPMQQLQASQDQGFPKNLYPTGPQLPLNEDPNNFRRVPAPLMSFPQPMQQQLPRFEGPSEFRRNPSNLAQGNFIEQSNVERPMMLGMEKDAVMAQQQQMMLQQMMKKMQEEARGKAPENQLLPKMQIPQDFKQSPNAWVAMSTSIQVRPADKSDTSIPDLRPPSEQFLPNLQKAQSFGSGNVPSSGHPNSAGIELKDHDISVYTAPPKVDKPTERPPQYQPQTTVPPRTEKPTPKPTKRPQKPAVMTTTTPSTKESDEYDDEEEDEESDYGDVDERNIAVSTAVANGHYYLLLPDGKLQKVSYKASNAGKDPSKGPYKADLVYQNVEPIKGPIYKFDGNALVRLN